MDNGNHKNLISQDQVQHVQIPTMTHPTSYQLFWVQKGGLCFIVLRCSAFTIAIGPFKDRVTCLVSPLDYAEFLLRLPYQQARQVVYHAKSHQYHLQLVGCTYVLYSSPLKSTHHITNQASLNQVSGNQCVSFFFVCPIDPNNQNTRVPPSMAPSLKNFHTYSPNPQYHPHLALFM